MEPTTLILFAFTVFPLICTPGPDILFTASQGLANGYPAAVRAVTGILLGYTAHAGLSALGIAALVSTSPYLFSLLKWIGVLYLLFLASQMLYSSIRQKEGIRLNNPTQISIWRGFFTSFLNPKGLLMYLAILPQFITPDGNTAFQALILSVLFICGCGLVYMLVGLVASQAYGRSVSGKARRRLEAAAGFMLAGAAIKIARQVN
jgi:threonine/homoserine/homoserine lactone efflux protein